VFQTALPGFPVQFWFVIVLPTQVDVPESQM
jgi:hypothetical protein